MEDTGKERLKYAAFAMIAIAVFLVFVVRSHRETDNEIAPQTNAKATAASKFIEKKIDINAATEGEFSVLPGIGPKLAKRIVEKRSELKGFKTIDELTKVSGIGKKKLNAIRAMVKVKAG